MKHGVGQSPIDFIVIIVGIEHLPIWIWTDSLEWSIPVDGVKLTSHGSCFAMNKNI